MDKVTGVAECVSHIWKAKESILSRLHENLVKDESSLEATWLILRDYPYMGPFMAYEVVTDLRHTYLLENAKDILTWANAGPGAMRGLNRLTGRPLDYSRKSHPWCEEMQDLFEQVKKILAPSIIFRNGANYEMREIEGGLCEFDKYSRIYKSEGRTRSVYKHNNLPMVEDLIEGESKYGQYE
jgi:sRNA-binding regulator protein Hfq